MLLSRLALLPLEPRGTAADSPYDRVQRAMLRYDQVLRRSCERVDRCVEQIRRDHARRELLAALPEAILCVQGPARGITGGRIHIDNQRERELELSFRVRPFRVAGDDAGACPGLGVRPASPVLAPGTGATVTLWIDFANTSFGANELVFGDIEVLVEEQVELLLGVEVTLY